MKIRHAALAAIFSSLVLGGCATVDGAAQKFPVTAQRVCSVVQPTFLSVNAQAALLNPPLSADDQTRLDGASAAVNDFCAATATATAGTAQDMLNATIPVVAGIISRSNLTASSRNALLLSLVGVQTAANILISGAQDGAVSQ